MSNALTYCMLVDCMLVYCILVQRTCQCDMLVQRAEACVLSETDVGVCCAQTMHSLKRSGTTLQAQSLSRSMTDALFNPPTISDLARRVGGREVKRAASSLSLGRAPSATELWEHIEERKARESERKEAWRAMRRHASSTEDISGSRGSTRSGNDPMMMMMMILMRRMLSLCMLNLMCVDVCCPVLPVKET